MWLEANSPAKKDDDPSLRQWMEKYVQGFGDIPVAKALRENYVPKIGKENMEEFKRLLKDQKVVLMCDQATDCMGRCV
ncbi:hypothetical protein PR048_021313 [Dryococelus australis]|uniref:Uncharacterized protein n=1 Tax=Dryococelus australis TaxID=614101 RepID=A0ABQ9GXY3_9NEOP|nr:hypothetical protein PR048_021313 [Dryococelus australis]